MKTLWGVAVAVLLPAAIIVSGASAVGQSPSGDTCSATGNGNSYTLLISVPSGAPAQGGFAFGASGTTVTNIDIPGTTGTLSTQNLPINTTGQWLLASPLASGSITASVVTSSPVSGSFTMVETLPAGSFFDPVVCALKTARASNVFTLETHRIFRAGVWTQWVDVAGAGELTFATTKGLNPNSSSPLIRGGGVKVTSAGRVKVMLRPTAAGQAALNATGSIKISLKITFAPRGGTPAHKVVSMTLRPKM